MKPSDRGKYIICIKYFEILVQRRMIALLVGLIDNECR